MSDTKNKSVVEIDDKLKDIAVDLLDMIAGGADEDSVCKHFSINKGRLIRWMIKYPDFEKAIGEARRQRADTFRTMIHKSIFDTDGKSLREVDKDDVPGEKLTFEKLKWLASIDDPDKYGAKVKSGDEHTSPVQIVVDTGVNKVSKVNNGVDDDTVIIDKENLL